MKPFEEQFTAWVDGKLTGEELAEFEKHLDQHPEAMEEKAGALKLGQLLREHPTAPRLSNPEFFNHQLMQQIAADMPRPVAKAEKKSFFWSIPGLAWAGACCLIIAGALFVTMIPGGAKHLETSNYFAQVVESWPAQNVSASTVYDKDDNVTVVWLDGLEYIPASYALNK